MDEVILLKSSLCGYCAEFEPIYNNIKKKYNKKYHFESFDISDDNEIKKLQQKYNDIYEKYKDTGVPTVLLKVNEKVGEILIPQINEKTEENIKEATKLFYKNLKKVKKTMNSNKYKVYTQNGGDEYYKHKYLKYKQKYLLMKQ